MKTTFLRHCNAVYIFRAIVDGHYSVEEIAEETEMSIIAVKKILYDLYNRNFLTKYKNAVSSVGRPKIYFCLNPSLHSTLIKKDETQFIIKSVNVLGEIVDEFTFPLHYQGFSESGSLRMLRATIKASKSFKHNLGIFLIGNNIDKIENLSLITKTTTRQMILDSLYFDDLVIFAEINYQKYLINYGKIKEIDISVDELEKIIDLDRIITLNDPNQEEYLLEALRLISLMKIEEKI